MTTIKKIKQGEQAPETPAKARSSACRLNDDVFRMIAQHRAAEADKSTIEDLCALSAVSSRVRRAVLPILLRNATVKFYTTHQVTDFERQHPHLLQMIDSVSFYVGHERRNSVSWVDGISFLERHRHVLNLKLDFKKTVQERWKTSIRQRLEQHARALAQLEGFHLVLRRACEDCDFVHVFTRAMPNLKRLIVVGPGPEFPMPDAPQGWPVTLDHLEDATLQNLFYRDDLLWENIQPITLGNLLSVQTCKRLKRLNVMDWTDCETTPSDLREFTFRFLNKTTFEPLYLGPLDNLPNLEKCTFLGEVTMSLPTMLDTAPHSARIFEYSGGLASKCFPDDIKAIDVAARVQGTKCGKITLKCLDDVREDKFEELVGNLKREFATHGVKFQLLRDQSPLSVPHV